MSAAMPLASISNIAWPADRDAEALDLAAELGFSGIEVAPAKVFGSLDAADGERARRYRAEVEARGLAIPAMQAILFGVTDAQLFVSAETRARLAARLAQVAAIAEALGAGACVFGSPTLRDPGDLAPDEALRIAVDVFAEAAAGYAERGVSLCFEANPLQYQCRFVTRTREAIALVEAVGRPGFALQLDTGTVFINGEDAATVEAAGRLAAHAHVSEPDLAAVGTTAGIDHAAVGAALARSGYAGWRSVEMRATEDWRGAMTRAAEVVRAHYVSGRAGA